MKPTSSPALAPPALAEAGNGPAGANRRSLAAIGAVLLGAMISTLTSRITSLGLADIRGALGIGFDEGSWINTVFTAGQMFAGPIAVWAAFVFGTQRVLLAGAAVFVVAETILPLCTDFPLFIALQTCAGLSSGVFVPTTVSFIVRALPPRWIPFGIAAYAMNLEMSLNISATLEGWYNEHFGWHWFFWQNVVLCLPFVLCLLLAMQDEPQRTAEGPADYTGMLLGAGSFSCLVVALDQGERLFWFQSPLIVGLLLAGSVLLAGFIAHLLASKTPSIALDYLLQPNVAILIVLIALIRFCVLNTSFIPSIFLTAAHNLRPTQIGDTMRWIAIPQLLFAPAVAFLLLRVDARHAIKFGFAAVAVAFALGTGITSAWTEPNFIPSQLLQALGQTMALTSVVYFLGKHVTPQHALTFGAIIQTTRLFSGQLGSTSLAITQRVFEHLNSNLLGLHIDVFNPLLRERLSDYSATLDAMSPAGPTTAPLQAVALLDRATRIQAVTLAIADNYSLAALCAFGGIALALLLRPAPHR